MKEERRLSLYERVLLNYAEKKNIDIAYTPSDLEVKKEYGIDPVLSDLRGQYKADLAGLLDGYKDKDDLTQKEGFDALFVPNEDGSVYQGLYLCDTLQYIPTWGRLSVFRLDLRSGDTDEMWVMSAKRTDDDRLILRTSCVLEESI